MKALRLIENAAGNAADVAIEPDHQEAHDRRHREAGECQLPGDADGTAEAGEDLERFGDRSPVNGGDPAGKHVGGMGDLGHEAGGAVLHELGPVEFEHLVEHLES